MVMDAASCESLTEIGRWVVFRREDLLGTTTQGMSHLQDLPETGNVHMDRLLNSLMEIGLIDDEEKDNPAGGEAFFPQYKSN